MKDLPLATDLLVYLGENNVRPVMVPSADMSPTEGMSLFEDNVKKAFLFIVIFGSVARTWVQQRLLEASKLILLNQLPTQMGVYVAPPVKPTDEVTFPYEVAINTDRFHPETIDRLLGKVNQRK